MRAARVALVAVLVVAALPMAAVAQDPSASEVALARRLYGQGLGHARAGRWAEAKSAFERSLELAPRPATRLNLATAQLETGELVAAAENYRRYLQEADQERHRERARALLAELEPRIPSVRVEIAGLGADDRVEVDGEDISHAALGQPLPIDPGTHTLTVRRGGSVLESEEITLTEGERKEVALRVPPPIEPSLVTEVPSSDTTPSEVTAVDAEDEGGAPVFWIAAGAVAIGAAILAVVLLASASEDTMGPHYEGNVGSIPVR